jgi:predicted GNAT family acetyltransferase
MPTTDAVIEVRDAPRDHRYEILVDGALAGFTQYRVFGDAFAYTHTEVDDAFAGQGLASKLVKAALEEMRARGTSVLPYCPYVRRYISRHHEYLDLVPVDRRSEFDLPS